MGKKAREQAKQRPAAAAGAETEQSTSALVDGTMVEAARAPPDLPEEQPGTKVTKNPALQAQLNRWSELCKENKIRELAQCFVPLDLTPDELNGFVEDLEGDPPRWACLSHELQLLAEGRGVTRIRGDQVRKAEFQFEDPLRPQIDRAVVFTCVGGEWRAEG